ncbi:MAG: DNA-binding response regulator [Candidatus Levybacteria bacterium RBG_13_35_9]|nr:MAG: DNA-binding response regulator [Candidatus Levybacteria bacterium RBG_13_35_9]
MRVLIVEDEHKIANSIKQGLEQEKYAVDVAYDGESGLDFAIGEEYDVIILDRMLPKTPGIEIVKKIREKNIHTPVLFLTAKGQTEDRIEGLNAGADDYLPKPFAFAELLARIRALSRRPHRNTGAILKVKDIELNPHTFEVRRLNKAIILSNKEFSLLEYLMRHPNQTIKKDQIIAHVWNYEADVLPNSVEVYVNHLRDKLGKPNIIHTVRGFGYKIGDK